MTTVSLPIIPTATWRAVTAKPRKRFTVDGNDELEDHLAHIVNCVLAGVRNTVPQKNLEALLLGGGYGRGQGGVLKTDAGDQPYNDLEFYVCLRGDRLLNDLFYRESLHELAERLSVVAGVEVEFKIISLAHLRRSAPSMFYYDLVIGHRWLWGDERLLFGCEHHRDASLIPLHEATRLLMNRCSGLLFAREKLGHEPFTAEAADFVGRNVAKAQLAFGDMILAVFGQYHWSCTERHKRLQRLQVTDPPPQFSEACWHHAAGVKFKLYPQRSQQPALTLTALHQELTALGLQLWLWLENRRLAGNFQSARDYALNSADKCPETCAWRNYLVNLKLFGSAAALRNRCLRHPRERILNVLARLLWESSVSNIELRNWACKELVHPTSSYLNLTDIYRALWRHLS